MKLMGKLALSLLCLALAGCGTENVFTGGKTVSEALGNAVDNVSHSLDVVQRVQCFNPDKGGCGPRYVTVDFHPVSQDDAITQMQSGAVLIVKDGKTLVRRFYRYPLGYTPPGYYETQQQWPPETRCRSSNCP